MASEIEVRRAVPADLERVGSLTVAAYADFLTGAEDAYADKLRNAAARASEAELWVAVDGTDVLGSVTLCLPGSPWREIGTDDEGEFRMLAVDPAAQGRGVGATLLAHAVASFAQRGFAGIVLSSLPAMTSAHRLYERDGFVRAPSRDWSPVPGVALVAYERSLSAARELNI